MISFGNRYAFGFFMEISCARFSNMPRMPVGGFMTFCFPFNESQDMYKFEKKKRKAYSLFELTLCAIPFFFEFCYIVTVHGRFYASKMKGIGTCIATQELSSFSTRIADIMVLKSYCVQFLERKEKTAEFLLSYPLLSQVLIY